MLPAVASTIVSPGRRTPRRSASSTIASAMRSFTLPPGLRCSHLTSTGTSSPAASGPSAHERRVADLAEDARLRRAASAARRVVRLEVELEELLDLRDPATLDEARRGRDARCSPRTRPRRRTPSRARSGTRSVRPSAAAPRSARRRGSPRARAPHAGTRPRRPSRPGGAGGRRPCGGSCGSS